MASADPVVDPAPPTGPLPRAARQEAILRGAARAFARAGYAGTSMEDIAAASGITKLIVYRHFDSKEELYRAVLQQVFDRLAEEFVTGYSRGAGGVGARSLLTVAREYPDGFHLLWRHAATGRRRPARVGSAHDRRRARGRRPQLARVRRPGPRRRVRDALDRRNPRRHPGLDREPLSTGSGAT